jgi:hypothetical protein
MEAFVKICTTATLDRQIQKTTQRITMCDPCGCRLQFIVSEWEYVAGSSECGQDRDPYCRFWI